MDGSKRHSKRKPCSVCRRWFTPDARVGSRQRTCGKKCRKVRKKKTQEAWSKRNPTYWTERRLRQQVEKLADNSMVRPTGAPPELSGLPVDWVQAEIGAEVLVIILFLARVLHRAAQAEMRRQHVEMTREIGEVRAWAGQVEMASGRPAAVKWNSQSRTGGSGPPEPSGGPLLGP